MLSRFRKARTRLSDPDPGVRLRAIADIRDPDARLLATLEGLALDDVNLDVRVQAIGLLDNDRVLGQLLNDKAVALIAASRIAARLQQGSTTTHASHLLVLKATVALGATADLSALADADPATQAELVIASRGEARQQILDQPAFQQASVLTQLERTSRDKDKSVNRFARERLERIKLLRKNCLEYSNRLTELLAALEKHVTVNADTPGHPEKREKLNDEATVVLTRLSRALEQIAGHGETPVAIASFHDRLMALPAMPEIAPVTTEPDMTSSAVFDELVSAFSVLADDLKTDNDFARLKEKRRELTQRWLEEADHQPPHDSQHKVFETVSTSFRELADAVARLSDNPLPEKPAQALPGKLPANANAAGPFWRQVGGYGKWLRQGSRALQDLNWPAWAPPAPEAVDFSRILESVQVQIDEIAGLANVAKAQLEANHARLTSSVDEGASRSAQRILNQSRQLLPQVPRDHADRFSKLLNREAARLGELKDWQTFATTPKRELLCEAMAQLVERPIAPADQAQRIKTLRSQWNELGIVSASTDRNLAGKFNALAEQAFEPCRSYFAEQSEHRGANLRARQEICGQLDAYLQSTHWNQANVKAAEGILRTAREEWRRFHPVDRKPGKPLEDRFEALQSDLHARIKAVWDNNLAVKRSIVEEAEALLDPAVAVVDKVNGAKALQQRWRTVGPTPRRPDQALWRKFRQVCDKIFDARGAEKQAADQALRCDQENLAKLLEEFARGLAHGAPTPATLRDFRQQFQALRRLPERLQRPLDTRFAELERKCREQLDAQADAARRDELRSLKDLDASISRAEAAHKAGEDAAYDSSQPLFAQRWKQVDETVPLDALKRLTVEAEIAAEIGSDPEDGALRLSIQVDLMNTGLGRRALTGSPLEWADRWCALGPKCDEADVLRTRFFHAIELLAKV